jgi:hypothetical protein
MTSKRWRFLPDRSQALLVVGVLLALFFIVSFANLALARSNALAERNAALTRRGVAAERNHNLRTALDAAQRDMHIPAQAEIYFGETVPGNVSVRPLPEDASPGRSNGNSQGAPPFWENWWERLTQP